MKLRIIPNYKSIQEAISTFNEDNIEVLEKNVRERYKLLKSDFSVLQLRFCTPFIKSQANLFSNPFNRDIERSDLFDISLLNDAEKRAERIFHLTQRAGILISMGDTDPLSDDTSIKQPRFEVLTPLEFHHDDIWWFVKNGKETIIYQTVGEFNQKIVEAYKSPKEFQEVVSSFDDGQDFFGVDAELAPNYKLEYVPIIEWKNEDNDNIIISPMVSLEASYINNITWGLYNADPKMLNQIILKTEKGNEEVRQDILQNYGKTTKLIKIGTADNFAVFDTGDVTVLQQVLEVYKSLVEQMALTKGVDITSIIRNTGNVSGESKRFDLGYINRIRNDFKIPAKIFDKKIFNLLKYNWNLDCGWKGLVFHDLDLVTDKKTDAEYAVYMREQGFWTPAESLSYVRQITKDEAEILMDEEGLIPKVGAISFDDTESSTSFFAPVIP